MKHFLWTAFCALFAFGSQDSPVGYDDTPHLPGGKWRVHDGTRPQPTVVAPGSGRHASRYSAKIQVQVTAARKTMAITRRRAM